MCEFRYHYIDTSKIAMCEFRYHYIKLKYVDKQQLCYMDLYSSIIYIKTEDIYPSIGDVETRFDTSSYKVERLLVT